MAVHDLTPTGVRPIATLLFNDDELDDGILNCHFTLAQGDTTMVIPFIAAWRIGDALVEHSYEVMRRLVNSQQSDDTHVA